MPGAGAERRALVGGLALALASSLVTLLSLEAGCRLRSRLRSRGDAGAWRPQSLSDRGRASGLGDLVRASRNHDIVYELVPGLDVSFRGARLTTSSAGFRDREYRLEKPPGVHRILGVGDSVMFGWGVADGENYLSLLEERLSEAHPDERWEAINMAVPGYNSVMEVEALREKGLAYGPDLVVVGFCGNDMSLPNFLQERASLFSVDRSLLVDFVRARLSRTAFDEADSVLVPLSTGSSQADATAVPPRYAHMVGLPAFERAMRRLRETQQEEGFEVLVLFYPGPIKQVGAIVRRLGFHSVSLASTVRAFLRESGGRDAGYALLRLSAFDPHPTPLGHRLIADGLGAYLEESGLRARLGARGPKEHAERPR